MGAAEPLALREARAAGRDEEAPDAAEPLPETTRLGARRAATRTGGPKGGELSGIGQVATRTGVSERTLRYYEEIGLLSPTGHRRGGSRLYSPADVQRVEHIRELQSLMGFNLEEIRHLMDAEDHLESLRERYRQSGDPAHQRQVHEEALRALEGLRAQVRSKHAQLEAFLARLDAKIERHRQYLEDRASGASDQQAAPRQRRAGRQRPDS